MGYSTIGTTEQSPLLAALWKVKKIEMEITEVCSELTGLVGGPVGWTDARELAAKFDEELKPWLGNK